MLTFLSHFCVASQTKVSFSFMLSALQGIALGNLRLARFTALGRTGFTASELIQKSQMSPLLQYPFAF